MTGMRSVLLDTGILIRDVRSRNILESPLFKIAEQYEQLFIAAVTDFEFRIGCKKPAQLSAYEDMLIGYGIQLLALDPDCSKAAAEVHLMLKRKNRIIGRMDTLIAGTALAKNLPLATLNRKHFERIPNLQLV